MVDPDRVASGFDVEFAMSADFIRAFLLCSMDTGSIPWWSESSGTNSDGSPYHTATITHPPEKLRDLRLYPVYPAFEGNEHPYLDVLPLVYSAQGDEEFKVTILADSASGADIVLQVFPSSIDLLRTPPLPLFPNLLAAQLYIAFSVVFETATSGLLTNIGVELTLIDIAGPLIDAAVEFGQSKQDLLDNMKEQIDRRLPFALAGGGALQRIVTRKFVGDAAHPDCIGVYVNLVLQSGPAPNDRLADRGDVSLAQNLLEEGSMMAFALHAATYTRLADDFRFKLAREKEGAPGQYHYPLMNGDEQVGVIKGVSVYAERRFVGTGQPPVLTNVLVIDVHGEYALDNLPDPDFHLRIRLVPTPGERGLLEFELDFDLSFSAAAFLISLLLGVALTFVLPKLGLSFLFLSMLTLKIIEQIGEEQARAAVEAQPEFASFLDTLPNKLAVEVRRWDPLYSTVHRVEVADAQMEVDDDGMRFDAPTALIGRSFAPIPEAVVRTETRDPTGRMNGLVYRAGDLNDVVESDLVEALPATDRMPWEALLLPEGDTESYRVSLTLDQVADRIAAKDRHVREIDYRAQKVDVRENQIFQILALSEREHQEIERLTTRVLREEVRAAQGDALRERATEELRAELAREPTPEEIDARVGELVDAEVALALPDRLPLELDRRTTFDLEPFEFADLQQRKVLVLGRDHLVVRTMRRDDGQVTVYYRDYEVPYDSGASTADNLRSLPNYRHTDG